MLTEVAITTYKAMNTNGERQKDILSAFGRSLIIGIQGTCRRSAALSQVQTVFNYTCVGFPTDEGDRCSGVQVCVHKRMGKIAKCMSRQRN